MTETTTASVTDATRQEKWIRAGRGWGARPAEWAYLFEPYALPANQLMFDELGVGIFLYFFQQLPFSISNTQGSD